VHSSAGEKAYNPKAEQLAAETGFISLLAVLVVFALVFVSTP
jgi:hypothetical protein